MASTLKKTEFPGHSGAKLAARLDMPDGPVRAYALFAHCFTCSKDLVAVRRIAADLARSGIAVLRFDFTGLGSSEGEFSSTNFSSNCADLVSAADYLRENHQAPSILIGHSLGGAAVLSVAGKIDEAKAVVTIGAPADAAHVLHNFGGSLDEIQAKGSAEVSLGGRAFTISRDFVENAREQSLNEAIRTMRKALLVLHAPGDETVGIDNASAIFAAARHPKSFISLDKADHLLTKAEDAQFVAAIIAGWVSRYLPADEPQGVEAIEHVRVSETGDGKFQNTVLAGRHRFFADEPQSFGGLDTGPSPYDLLSAALGACTSMTLRLYAEKKKLDLGRVSVDVSHDKIHMADCEACTDEERASNGRIDQFDRVISVEGSVATELEDKLIEIAGKCPVHRTLEVGSKVKTSVKTVG